MSVPRVQQLTREQVAALGADELVEARRAGRLAGVLGGRGGVDWARAGQLARADLAELTVEEVAEARARGLLDTLLAPPVRQAR